MASDPMIVQAIYSFKGTNNDELCFKKGDKITVTQREDGGWWEGTLGEKTGWFPSNYVKEIKDIGSPAMSPVRASTDVIQQRQYRAVVLKDLIDSEKAYITELQGLVTNFLQPLEKSEILSRDEYHQLTSNLNDVLETHIQMLALVEDCVSKASNEQRVGKLFLQWAPRIKSVHQTYCALHPKAVSILDKYKDDLTKFMETAGAASPGLLVLTTGLSKPFRRLDKYPGMLQELERHVEESHPDRGDTQRSVAVYKEIASVCAATRRQKELELQVLTGPVRGWEGQSLSQLGDILHMGSVAIGPFHHDRYLVLFSSTLLVLSVSQRMSAFIYEGKLPLTGITVIKLDDSETYKNAFEITGTLIESIVAVCQSREEAQTWVDLLQKHTKSQGVMVKSSPQSFAEVANVAPQPPPHIQSTVNKLNSSVVCKSNISKNMVSPPSTYPSAAPYYQLAKFFSRCVRHNQINRTLLKNLLYPEYLRMCDIDLASVKLRKHKTEFIFVKSSSNEWRKASIIVVSSESDSDDSDDDDDSDSSSSSNENNHRLSRQNAIDETDSEDGSCSSDYGFIRFNHNADYHKDANSTYESVSFIDHGENTTPNDSSRQTSKLHLGVINQLSDNSTFEYEPSKPSLACEDLRSIDESVSMSQMQPVQPSASRTLLLYQNRQSCPTKLVANKFNKSSLTSINIPGCYSNSENNLTSKKLSLARTSSCSTGTHSSSLSIPAKVLPVPDSLVAEILYNLEPIDNTTHLTPVSLVHQPDSSSSDRTVNTIKKISKSVPDNHVSSLTHENVHSYNRNNSSERNKDMEARNSLQRCTSYRYLELMPNSLESQQSDSSYCHCCVETCQSPRSSDSGMAGSCTLASPDIPSHEDMCTNKKIKRYSIPTKGSKTCSKIREKTSLSQMEPIDFENQCRCTSPFGSTPRTSCQPSLTCENILVDTSDSLATSITSSCLDFTPYPTPQPWESENQIQRKLDYVRKTQSATSVPQSDQRLEETKVEFVPNKSTEIYRSGMYAHWWLKAKIPASMIQDIAEESVSRSHKNAEVTPKKRDKYQQPSHHKHTK